MDAKLTIGCIVSSQEFQGWVQFLGVLAQSCGLGLRRVATGRFDGLIGVLVIGDRPPGVVPLPLADFHLVPVDIGVAPRALLRFGSHRKVPEPFRSRELSTPCVIPHEVDPPCGTVMATAEGRPVWISCVVEGQRHDTSWIAADSLDKISGAFDRLNGTRFMDFLPVLEWMRSISGFYEWSRPPVRACMMFDDPNMHALRYGYVDYPRLAEEGRLHRYHTSFATVPFDAYYVNPVVSRCFRENSDTLSLLVHGNNHTHRELAGGKDQHERLDQMRQALQRMKNLDQKTGLNTAKVMAPPHGACSEAMIRAMRDVGFEAACISPASVRSANLGARWTNDLGLYPAAMVSDFPVIPRFRLEANREGSIWLARYLDQPIIPVGHHWDLAEGTKLLARTSDIINKLGNVVWADIATLARRNYRHRVEGSRLRLQPFGRIVRIEVPEGVTSIEIEAPWLASSDRFVPYSHGEGLVGNQIIDGKKSETKINVMQGDCVDLELTRTELAAPTQALPRTPLRAILRRLLVEIRDRSMPYYGKIKREVI